MAALASEVLVPFPFLAEVAAFPNVGEGRERLSRPWLEWELVQRTFTPSPSGLRVVDASSPLTALSLPLFFSPKLLLLL